jgi:hypothetical protein
MPDLHYLRREIEHMRRQIVRQRKEMRDLERAGIPTGGAACPDQAKVSGLCKERDRQVDEQRRRYPGTKNAINGPIAAQGGYLLAHPSRRRLHSQILGRAGRGEVHEAAFPRAEGFLRAAETLAAAPRPFGSASGRVLSSVHVR